jgi:LacI family transcriptional regulator
VASNTERLKGTGIRATQSAPVRMKDIARALGLSTVTVSKVFRGHQDISQETRERVRKCMAEMHYQPNLTARSLATGRSFTMALLAPDLIHPFFSDVAKHLAKALRMSGYYLFMASSEEDETVEMAELEHLLARQVDVLILASCRHSSEGLQSIKNRNTPLLLIDRKFADYPTHFVGVDDLLVGRIATKHLIEQGCKRIAYVGSPYASTARSRLEGYRNELELADMPFLSEYCVVREHGDDAADVTGWEAMKQLLRLKPRPDAVFCNNDPTAVGAMKAILDAGLRIPQDVAVVGCGNIRHSDFLRVPLTTIDQNSAGIGVEAAKLALSLVGSQRKHKAVLLEPRLVARESSSRKA